MVEWIKYVLVAAAVPMSLFWGIYGIIEERRQEEEERRTGIVEERDAVACMKDCYFSSFVRWAGVFISEFLGSLAGWICLFTLLYRALELKMVLGVFDVFLGTAAIICITGFAHQFTKN